VSDPPKVAVIGAGSWGTAFAMITAGKAVRTVLWARRVELAEAIASRHENPDYIPGFELPPALEATHDMEKAVTDADVVVMAVPSHAFRVILDDVLPFVSDRSPLVSLTKGLEQGSLLRMTEVIREEGDLPHSRLAVVSGPNLAAEVVRGFPAATVVACADDDMARDLQNLFTADHMKVYTNPDVVGCELGGALKNVIAIAAGMADGMGFGDNTRATLLTRGLAELTRLGVRMGGNPLTFLGLAGMGDLIATCSSKLSRNHRVGEQLAAGRALQDIVDNMQMVAEGLKTSRAVVDLASRVDVEVPISEHVVKVIYEGMSPAEAVRSLMLREVGAELQGIG
jgi:glycerol-3-phosphate dehydrogenase (NAD(P)+)